LGRQRLRDEPHDSFQVHKQGRTVPYHAKAKQFSHVTQVFVFLEVSLKRQASGGNLWDLRHNMRSHIWHFFGVGLVSLAGGHFSADGSNRVT
jgi:hypothetical protein